MIARQESEHEIVMPMKRFSSGSRNRMYAHTCEFGRRRSVEFHRGFLPSLSSGGGHNAPICRFDMSAGL